MGWRRTVQAIVAAQRRAERETRRQHRAQLQIDVFEAKLDAIHTAGAAHKAHHEYLAYLVSLHKECGDFWDWASVRDAERPIAPVNSFERTEKAKAARDAYTPTFSDKLFGRVKKIQVAYEELVQAAQAEDSREYADWLKQYRNDMRDWEELQPIAQSILDGDVTAYMKAVRIIQPLSDVSIGSDVTVYTSDPRYVEVNLKVNSLETIPTETLHILSTGMLSKKPMTKTRFFELYQDHVCSGALRIAREMFALLPIHMVFVHAYDELASPVTGLQEEMTLLSVAIPRETLKKIDFQSIDCSDSMRNFIHNMQLHKTRGFNPVARLDPAAFQMPEFATQAV